MKQGFGGTCTLVVRAFLLVGWEINGSTNSWTPHVLAPDQISSNLSILARRQEMVAGSTQTTSCCRNNWVSARAWALFVTSRCCSVVVCCARSVRRRRPHHRRCPSACCRRRRRGGCITVDTACPPRSASCFWNRMSMIPELIEVS